MAQMGFTSGRLNRNARHRQTVVRTVHTALGGGLFVLLDGHDGLLKSVLVSCANLGLDPDTARIPPAITLLPGPKRKAKDYSPNLGKPPNGS
jgi:hypothetical protein